MEMNEYQRKAAVSMQPKCRNINYLALGIAGEAGEICDKIKRIIRGDGQIDEALLCEIGDLLWYISQLADFLKVPFEKIAQMNLEKLALRIEKGTIKGTGDKR